MYAAITAPLTQYVNPKVRRCLQVTPGDLFLCLISRKIISVKNLLKQEIEMVLDFRYDDDTSGKERRGWEMVAKIHSCDAGFNEYNYKGKQTIVVRTGTSAG